MTKPIKLTKENIECYKSGVYSKDFKIVIYFNSHLKSKKIKQQILDNQKIVERLQKLLDSKIEKIEEGEIRKCITTREIQSILTVNSKRKEGENQ